MGTPDTIASRRPLIRSEVRFRLWRWRPPLGGVLGSVLFFAASLTPSLLPRPWFVQAVVSGVGASIGYGVGSALEAVLRPHADRADWSRVPIWGRAALTAAAVAALSWAVIAHWMWQSDVRDLMGMEGAVGPYVVASFVGGIVAGYLLVLVARGGRWSVAAYASLLGRWMPRAAARALAVVTLAVATVVVFDVVVGDRLFVAVDRAYMGSNQRFDPDVVPPRSSYRSGGPGSLIPWESMGRQGRSFVAQGPDVAALEAFGGGPAQPPIRVYAGLDTAETAEDRVRLAMAELDRTGAFQREILVLVAPTGTGWVDPYAIDPLEYLYDGDTAAVAVQYSHRPSWLVMIGNQDLAIETSRQLFEAVSRRVADQPASSRPLLLLHGESLGSFALEAVFEDVQEVRSRTDGVLWVGPPRSNRIWSRLVNVRAPDSPLWRPLYQEGRSVRFGPDGAALSEVPGEWLRPRIVYLQHASDPITWLSIDLLFRRPEWLDEPRGPDVSERMPYLPLVTFWQVTVDLVMGTNAPEGHGHKFGPAQAEAWSLIVPPPGWTADDTRRLLEVVGE